MIHSNNFYLQFIRFSFTQKGLDPKYLEDENRCSGEMKIIFEGLSNTKIIKYSGHEL